MKLIFVTFTLFAIIASCPVRINAQESPYDKVFGYRISTRDGNSVKVQILVNIKGLSKGKTVKLKEKIPAGFRAAITDAYGATAEATETNVSYVWKVLPVADLFIIKYELTSPNAVSENVTISGNMSYMSDFGIKYISVVERNFATENDFIYAIKNIPPYKAAAVVVEDGQVAVNNNTQPVIVQDTKPSDDAPKPKPRTDVVETKPVDNNNTVTDDAPKPIPRTDVVETKPEEKPQPVVETKPEEKPVNVSSEGTIATSTGTFYCVQVGASGDKLASTYFNKYSFDKPVEENLENGMYKYLLGRFPTLKEANAYLAKVKAKGVACFVVAYTDGKRTTIKDALAVSGK